MLLLLRPRVPAEHVCFTYEGDDAPAFTYAGVVAFTYEGDDSADFTYEGEC